MKYFDVKKLAALLENELLKRNVQSEAAGHVTASLIQTSLRGVDSHGINLFPHYCRAVAAGRINSNPNITVNRTSPSTALIDADHSFGHFAGALAMNHAVSLAKESGIGAVSVRNSTHFGAAAYFGLMAPSHNCLGFAFTNADALVKAYGAREPFFGTNPICFTAPMENEDPFCLDMATSLVSWNKINNFRRFNSSIPSNWAFDANGDNITDPHEARSLNPVGEYKGFGLGMMIDILCALLASGLISKDVKAMYAPPLDSSKRCVSHFFIAMDISCFVEPEMFRHNLQVMADRVRSLPTQPGVESVMVAGDPEKRSFERRTAEGIPVDDSIYEEFLDLSAEFSEVVNC